MIEYALRDVDDNEFVLNDSSIDQPARDSFTFLNDSFANDNRVVPNSALPGSTKLGRTRLMSKELSFNFTRAHDDDSDFRDAENEFINFLQKAVAIVDKTNLLIAPIAVPGYNIDYGTGMHKHVSDNVFTVVLLDPFWKAITPDNVAQGIVAGVNNIALSNLGKLPSPPVITLEASVAITQIQIYIDETKDGIQIDDALFGTVSFNTLVIDCENGQLLLEGIDRTQSILPSSGYFEIPVGASTLKVVSTGIMTIDMDFNQRVFV